MARLPDIPSNLGSSGMDYLTAPLPAQGPDAPVQAPRTPDSQPRPDLEPTPIDMPPYHDMPEQDLRRVFTENPDFDKGIGAVLDAIEADKTARPGDSINTYERDIIKFARTEAVRAYENNLLKDVELDTDDIVLGRVHQLYEKFDTISVDPSLDDHARARAEVSKERVGHFLDRHADDDEPESPQKHAVELYAVAKKHYAALGTPQTGAHARAYSDALYQVHKATPALHEHYEAAAPQIKDALAQLDATVQPLDNGYDEALKINAKWDEVDAAEKQLAASYAKREEKARGLGGENGFLKHQYQNRLRELFVLEHKDSLSDPSKTPAQRLEIFNKYMFDRGHKLEESMPGADKVQGKFKKIAIKIGESMMKRHWLLQAGFGMGAAAVVGVLSGGALAGATAAGLAYARREAGQQADKKNRAKLFADDQRAANLRALEESDHASAFNTHGFSDSDLANLFDHSLSLNSQKFENRIIGEQNRRARSLGIAAMTGVAGFTVAHGFTPLEDFGTYLNGGTAEALPVDSPASDVDPNSPDPGAPEANGDGAGPEADDKSKSPEVENGSWFGDWRPEGYEEVPSGHDGPAHYDVADYGYNPEMFNVQPGQGFYNVLENMGVEPSLRDDVLARAADELYANGYAYQMPDGLPGIPSAGSLPQGAIDILIKAAAK